MKTSTLVVNEPAFAGMGAVIGKKGVGFRVWAPHAERVTVKGTFNEWNDEADELKPEGNGCWSAWKDTARSGHEYRFTIFTTDGRRIDRIDPYARAVTNSIGNGVIYDPAAFDWGRDAEFKMPKWNELVIYELHIGTFHVKEQGRPGTFYTAIEKLDHLVKLGINAVEVMPASEFAGDYSWGYNPAQPFAIESSYGGPDAFKTFVRECHARGIAVILDVVYNHFGPSDLDLWQFDGWSANDKGGIYFYNDWRSNTPWGDTRPDYGRTEVRQYIRDNAIMWLEEYHCDGLRMDMVPYIRNVYADGNPDNNLNEGIDMLRWINAEIRSRFPQKLTVAEDLHGHDFITSAIDHGGLGYGTQWDAEFVHPIRAALINADDEHRDVTSVINALCHKYNHDAFQRVIYTESHDEVANGKARVAEEIAPGDVDNFYAKARAALGIAMVLTAPGIPMLFQGQTLLEDRWFSDTDPLDWSRFEQFRGIARLHRDLIRLRRNLGGRTAGLTGQHIHILYAHHQDKVIAYQRWFSDDARDRVVVVLNLRNKDYDHYRLPFPTSDDWELVFNSTWEGYDDDFQGEAVMQVSTQHSPFGQQADLSIPAYAALVYVPVGEGYRGVKPFDVKHLWRSAWDWLNKL